MSLTQSNAPRESNSRNWRQPMRIIPDRGAAMAFNPGMNFATSRTRRPFCPKLTCVRRTQESGSSEIRQRNCRTRTPFHRPNSYHIESPEDRSQKRDHNRQAQIHAARASQCSGGEEHGRGGNGQPGLFNEDPREDQQVAMPDDELERLVHFALEGSFNGA